MTFVNRVISCKLTFLKFFFCPWGDFCPSQFVFPNGDFFHPLIRILFASGISLFMFMSMWSYRVFIKYCVFSKNYRKFATSPPSSFGCYWLYKKLPAKRTPCMSSASRYTLDSFLYVYCLQVVSDMSFSFQPSTHNHFGNLF